MPSGHCLVPPQRQPAESPRNLRVAAHGRPVSNTWVFSRSGDLIRLVYSQSGWATAGLCDISTASRGAVSVWLFGGSRCKFSTTVALRCILCTSIRISSSEAVLCTHLIGHLGIGSGTFCEAATDVAINTSISSCTQYLP